MLMGLVWWFIGLLAFVTIVGIPWAKACFVIGQFTFFPFGREAISRKELKQKDDIGTSGFGVLGNVIWFIFAGVWLAIGHIISALIASSRLLASLSAFNTSSWPVLRWLPLAKR
jgi:uncharacterized membrane protein YccF (DUF307 family)